MERKSVIELHNTVQKEFLKVDKPITEEDKNFIQYLYRFYCVFYVTDSPKEELEGFIEGISYFIEVLDNTEIVDSMKADMNDLSFGSKICLRILKDEYESRFKE